MNKIKQGEMKEGGEGGGGRGKVQVRK